MESAAKRVLGAKIDPSGSPGLPGFWGAREMPRSDNKRAQTTRDFLDSHHPIDYNPAEIVAVFFGGIASCDPTEGVIPALLLCEAFTERCRVTPS
jgi:hypothetical protein